MFSFFFWLATQRDSEISFPPFQFFFSCFVEFFCLEIRNFSINSNLFMPIRRWSFVVYIFGGKLQLNSQQPWPRAFHSWAGLNRRILTILRNRRKISWIRLNKNDVRMCRSVVIPKTRKSVIEEHKTANISHFSSLSTCEMYNFIHETTQESFSGWNLWVSGVSSSIAKSQPVDWSTTT